MIISKTPMRMSFVGGGSDIPSFYCEEDGAVVSTSIDKYMYICVNKNFSKRIRLSYSRTEDVEFCEQLRHPLVKESLQLIGIKSGIEIASMADIPSSGTGLGSSSSYTVGLLNALYAYQKNIVSKEILARKACFIEIERCGEPIGKQDQYAAAYGGLNFMRFNRDGKVSVTPIVCNSNYLEEFQRSILVFYTGRTRSASMILAAQSEALNQSKSRFLLRRMVQLAYEMKLLLEVGEMSGIGQLLDENWRLKRQLTQGVSDAQIDNWYHIGIKNGAIGGKLLGAGNGGFLMFFAPPDRHKKIIKKLEKIQCIPFGFDRNGSQIVYNQ